MLTKAVAVFLQFVVTPFPFFAPFVWPTSNIFVNNNSLPPNLPSLLQNEDIRYTWLTNHLSVCLQSTIPAQPDLNCFVRILGYEPIAVEVLSRRPVVLRMPQFLTAKKLKKVAHKVHSLDELDPLDVLGGSDDEGYMMRRADGHWLKHHELEELFERMQRVLALNPAISEDFLVLKYGTFGHYSPHYDHYEDEGWMSYLGNRIATAILLVETASKGGSTTFPDLDLNIVPERGDLILWMNADSNDRLEKKSLHAACPILEGQKIAISVWIRRKFQNELKCSLAHSGYEPEELIRNELGQVKGPRQRPSFEGQCNGIL